MSSSTTEIRLSPNSALGAPKINKSAPNRTPGRRWLGIVRLLAIAATFSLAVMSLVALFPNMWWPLWLLQQLRPQMALAAGVATVTLLALRCWPTAAVSMAAAVLNLAVLVPLFFGAASEETVLSVTHINVDQNKVQALSYANDYGSDITFLQEVQPTMEAKFNTMSNYRLVVSNPEPDTRGSAMLIRNDWDGRVVTSEVLQLHDYYRPFISTTLEVDGEMVTLLSFHAIRPLSGGTISMHRSEIQNLANWVANQGHPVIVVGDFNTTPWSSGVKPLKEEGLVISTAGYGMQSSWPASAPSLFRIPIDISLHSPEWATVGRSIGSDIGSDHLPVHLEFAPSAELN